MVHTAPLEQERLAAYLGPRLGALIDNPVAMEALIREVLPAAGKVDARALLSWAQAELERQESTRGFLFVRDMPGETGLTREDMKTLDQRVHVPLVRVWLNTQREVGAWGAAFTLGVFLIACAVLFFHVVSSLEPILAAQHTELREWGAALGQLELNYTRLQHVHAFTKEALSNATTQALLCQHELARFADVKSIGREVGETMAVFFEMWGMLLGKMAEGMFMFLWQVCVEIPTRFTDALFTGRLHY